MEQLNQNVIQPLHQNVYQPVQNAVNPPLNNFLTTIFGDSQPGQPDSIAMTVLKMLLILYSGMIAPKLPVYVLEWFDYVPFKIFVLFLIAWTGSHDPSLSLLIAVTFYASLNALNGKKFFENFESAESLAQEADALGFYQEPVDPAMDSAAEAEMEAEEDMMAEEGLPTDDFAAMPGPTEAPTFFEESF